MIERIEIDKRGGIALQFGARGQWYDFTAFPPREIDPLRDPAIPLSRLAKEHGLEVVAYRPSRRLVASGRQDGVDVVWKGYRQGTGKRHVRKYRLAADALRGSGVGTVTVLETLPDRDVIKMRRQLGERPRLSAGCAPEFELMGAGTRWLQAFKAAPDTLDRFSRDDELAVLDERIRRLRLAGGQPPDHWEDLRANLAAAASLAAPGQVVVTHRDLHDGQWLVHEGRPCLLDFDLLSLAEPELDPANFVAHLELRRLQHPRRISGPDLRACRDAFLQGMSLPDESGSRIRLTFYQATTFARLALVYQLRPRWQNLAAKLVALGHSRLDELSARVR